MSDCERNFRVVDLAADPTEDRWLIVIEQEGQRRLTDESPHEWTTLEQLDAGTWGFTEAEDRILRRAFRRRGSRRGEPLGPSGRRLKTLDTKGARAPWDPPPEPATPVAAEALELVIVDLAAPTEEFAEKVRRLQQRTAQLAAAQAGATSRREVLENPLD